MSRGLRPAVLGLLGVLAGCSIPSAVAPQIRGSVGLPHSGFLTDGKELSQKGKGFVWRRPQDHHWGVPRMVAMLEEASAAVVDARPGSQPVVVGELSAKGGGALMPTHRSHRTGRDVDVLFYVTSLEGVPLVNSDFVKIGPDGLGVSSGGRFVRFDTARQWQFIKSLVATKHAHVQWIFISRVLEALLVEHALALGEPPALIQKAQTVMQQPGDSLPHDDHIHVRIACEAEEFARGCDGGGPQWGWLPRPAPRVTVPGAELVAMLVTP